MAEEWSEQKESVAHHEAGHRVMASIVGAPPTKVVLRLNDQGSWEGDVLDDQKSEVDPTSLIRIAYAGPWAEIKYQARRKWVDATFDPEPPESLITELQEPESDDDNFGPIHRVKLRTGTGIQSLTIDPNAFSNDDRKAFRLARGNKSLIRKFLLQTRDELDKPAVWSAIEALAKALLNRLGSRRSVTFPAGGTEKIIQDIVGRFGAGI